MTGSSKDAAALAERLEQTLSVMRVARISNTKMSVWSADVDNVQAAIAALRAAANPTEVEPAPTLWLGTPDPKAVAARLRDPNQSAGNALRHEAAAMLERLAPSPGKAGDVRAALEKIASFPLEESNQLKRDEDTIYRFNDWQLTVGEVKRARAALAVTHHDGGAV